MKKRIWSRRKKALLFLTIPALLAAAMSVGMGYGYIPSMGLREMDEYTGTGRTETVARLGVLTAAGEPVRGYISVNGEAARLSFVEHSWRWGWQSGRHITVDCAEGEGLHGQIEWFFYDEGNRAECWVFGRVDRPEGTAVELRLSYEKDGVPDGEEPPVRISRENWAAWKDKSYFWAQVPVGREKLDENTLCRAEFTLLDGDGRAIAWAEDAWGR